jgi:hypothetical protein
MPRRGRISCAIPFIPLGGCRTGQVRTQDILGGVIAGVIASTLCIAAAFIWRSAILPRLLEMFYETTSVHDLWEAGLDFGTGRIHNIQVRLTKRGKWVHGMIEFVSGRHQGKRYPLSGHYKSGILTFTYEAEIRKSTAQGSGTFERCEDGELFRGHLCYYSPERQAIGTVPCDLRPIKN